MFSGRYLCCCEWSLEVPVGYLGSLTQAAEALVGLAAETAEEDVYQSSHGLQPPEINKNHHQFQFMLT